MARFLKCFVLILLNWLVFKVNSQVPINIFSMTLKHLKTATKNIRLSYDTLINTYYVLNFI